MEPDFNTEWTYILPAQREKGDPTVILDLSRIERNYGQKVSLEGISFDVPSDSEDKSPEIQEVRKKQFDKS